MPIQRFGSTLISKGQFDAYLQLLSSAHRADNLGSVMRRPGLRSTDNTLVEQIPWGSDRVGERTGQGLDALGWHWSRLDPLRDIDHKENLAYLPARLYVLFNNPVGGLSLIERARNAAVIRLFLPVQIRADGPIGRPATVHVRTAPARRQPLSGNGISLQRRR